MQADSQTSDPSYATLADYEAAHPKLKKYDIAKKLRVNRPRYSYLRRFDIYHPRLSDDEVSRLAKLLNQTEAYVRELFMEAA